MNEEEAICYDDDIKPAWTNRQVVVVALVFFIAGLIAAVVFCQFA